MVAIRWRIPVRRLWSFFQSSETSEVACRASRSANPAPNSIATARMAITSLKVETVPNCFALHWQLDVRVEGMNILARRVTHEGLPHVLDDPGLHQPGI